MISESWDNSFGTAFTTGERRPLTAWNMFQKETAN